jgi:uncharacterized membrane protein YfcA
VWRTRGQLAGVLGRGWLWLLLIPSVLGGLIGAVLLSRTDNRNFIQLVPWLVLVATILIVLRPILVRRDESGSVHPDITVALWPVAIAGIFLVALYGGYFGAGIGILMIGALSFISRGDIRHVVALKNFLTLCMRGAAILVLVLEGNVNWNYGVPMALGGLVGGYVGGMVSHRANRTVVRSIVIAIGFAASAYYFWKLYGPAVVPGRRRIAARADLEDQESGQISDSYVPRMIVMPKREPQPAPEPKPVFVKEHTPYERVNYNHSGIRFGVGLHCVARSQRGQNFGGNRSSRRDIAGGTGIDWSWLG